MGGINGKAWTNTYANYLLIVLTISACSFLIMRPHGLSITAKFLTTPTAADSMELRVVANLSFLTAEWQHFTGIMFVAGTYDRDEQTYKLGMRVYTIPGAGQQSISMLGYAELQGEDLKLNGATVLDTKNNTDRPFVALGPEDPRSIVDPYGNLLFSFHQPHMVPINNIPRLLRPQFLLNMTTEEVSLLKHSQYDVLLEQNVQPEMSVAAGMEKNWVPFFYKDELYFVTSIKPLRIVGPCKHRPDEHNNDATAQQQRQRDMYCDDYYTEFASFADRFTNANNVQLLRGGTQMKEHSYGVYYGFAHTRFVRDGYLEPNQSTVVHRPVLIVLTLHPMPKLHIHSDWIPVVGLDGKKVDEDIIDPVAIVRTYSNGTIMLSLSFDSKANVLALCDGVPALLARSVPTLERFAYNERYLLQRMQERFNSKTIVDASVVPLQGAINLADGVQQGQDQQVQGVVIAEEQQKQQL